MKSMIKMLIITGAAVVILSSTAFGGSPTSITKTANPSAVASLPYYGHVFTINYQNNSLATVNNYQIWDTVPAGYFPSAIYSGGAMAGNIITWNIGTLAPSAAGSVSFTSNIYLSSGPVTYNVAMDSQGASSQAAVSLPSPSDTPTYTVTCTQTFTFTPYISGSITPTFTQTMTPVISGATSITKTANYTTLPFFPYSGLIFTINYGNNTGGTINNYQIWDTLPAYYTPATIYDGGTAAGGIVTWNIGTLAPGAYGAVSFTADVWNSAGPVVINHAMDSMGATSQVSINQPSPTDTNTMTLTVTPTFISGSTTPAFTDTVTPTYTPYVFGSMTPTFTVTGTATMTTTPMLPVLSMVKSANPVSGITDGTTVSFNMHFCNTGGIMNSGTMTLVDDYTSSMDNWQYDGPYYTGNPAVGINNISASNSGKVTTYTITFQSPGFTGCVDIPMIMHMTSMPVDCAWYNKATLQSWTPLPTIVSTVNMSNVCSSPTFTVTPTATITVTSATGTPTPTFTSTVTSTPTATITLTSFAGTSTYTPTFTMTYTVTRTMTRTPSFTPTPTFTVTGTATCTMTFTSTVTLPGSGATSITKTANPSTLTLIPFFGLVFTINYQNTGSATINNYQIWDTLPAYYMPGTINNGGTLAGNVITWNIGTLAPGAAGSVSFKADIIISSGPVAYNNAMDSQGAISQVMINQPSPTVTPTPTMTLTLAAGSYTVTQTVTMTITYTTTCMCTVSFTPTFTPTAMVTGTPTPTFTFTVTNTPTATITLTIFAGTSTRTPTFTPTPSFTSTLIGTPTFTPTLSITVTSGSGTPAFTVTRTITPSFTATSYISGSMTPTYTVTSTPTTGYTSPCARLTGRNIINPLNGETIRIEHCVPSPCRIKIIVYDRNGKNIRTIEDDNKAAGIYTLGWDGLNKSNTAVASGIYIIYVKICDFEKKFKVVVRK